MVWIKDKPRLDGEWYWFRPLGSGNSEARPVKIDFESSDFQMTNGEWSHRPIPYPIEEKELKNEQY